jgi:hypothetical protein
MPSVPVIAWIVLALWSAVIVYVFVNVRGVIANNHKAISSLIGRVMPPISDRMVAINRVALAVLLVVSDWAILHFNSQI